MRSNVFLRNALFCVSACFLLNGCAAPGTPSDSFKPRLDESYSLDAAMEYGDGKSAQLALTRYAAGSWEAEFSEPETLSGVLLRLDGNAVSASYKGLAFTVPKSAMPAKTMLCLMTDVLDGLGDTDALSFTAQQDGSHTAEGDAEGGHYILTFADGGELTCFEMPGQPLKITCTNYQPIVQQTEQTTLTETTASMTSATETITATTENEGVSQ